MNTQIATAAAMLGWLLVEKFRDGQATTLGAASGAVAGLVAITPPVPVVTPLGRSSLGLIAGAVCALAVGLKYKLGFDDSLDVVGVHLVGGIVGSILIGFFATAEQRRPAPTASSTAAGSAASCSASRRVAVLSVVAFSFVAGLHHRQDDRQDHRLPDRRG